MFKFDVFVTHLLEEIRAADNTFNSRRQQFRNEVKSGALPFKNEGIPKALALSDTEIYDLAADKISLEEVMLTFYLKKHSPGFFRRFWLKWIRRIDPDYIFDVGNKDDYTFPVVVKVKRSSAFTVLVEEKDPKETDKVTVRL